MRTFSLIALIFIPVFGFAQRDRLKPLMFAAERNGLQVLAQRFEYALLDSEKLRIGDVTIDAAKLRFGFTSSAEGSQLMFSWPAGLLTQGELSLLNNNGKALWSAMFAQDQLKIRAERGDEDHIRADLAQYTSAPVPPQLIDRLKMLPFFNFCISHGTEAAKIYLCSQDFYIHVEANGASQVRNRAGRTKQAAVDINGRAVTPQGLVYLNDASEELFLRAQTESGASIELVTKKKELEFRDVVMTKDGKRLLLRTRGAQPAGKKRIRHIGGDEYEIILSKERPFYYILGEGGIPMRQEFLVRGAIPREEMRPFLHPMAPTRTYASSVEWMGVAPESVKLSTQEPNENLQDLSKNRFLWQLRDLDGGKVNRRDLRVETGETTFFAGSEIERGRPNLLGADVFYSAPDGIAFGGVEYQRWLEGFRWGFGLSYDKNLNKKEDLPEVGIAAVSVRFRFTPGFVLRDETAGLGFLAGQISVPGASLTAFGLEGFWQKHLEGGAFARRFPWWETSLKYWPSSSGTDVKLASMWKASVDAHSPLSETSFLRLSLGFSQTKMVDQTEGGAVQADVGVGILTAF